jgi:hypothetical protein
MRQTRRLAGALVLATLLPLAGCRHGGAGLESASATAKPAPTPPSPAAGLYQPPPAGSGLRARIDPAEAASLRQLEHPLPPPHHRHTGAPALSHTFHLSHPRYH